MRFADATTMQVGGEADAWIDATSREEAIAAVREAADEQSLFALLGGGSNTVASNDPFEGLVVRMQTKGISVLPTTQPIRPLGEERRDDSILVRVEAGENWDAVVERAVGEGWRGIEALSGIPGSVGAAPVQNIGAYGQELANVLEAIEFYDIERDAVERIPASHLRLGYRDSAIKRGLMRGIVLSVDLHLGRSTDGLGDPIGYSQLAKALGVDLGARVPLDVVRSSVIELRASKGMVLSDDPDSVSAGSFFTNPVVPLAAASLLPDEAPRWTSAPEPVDLVAPLDQVVEAPIPDYAKPELARAQRLEQRVKLSAAWLIEHAGITRGFSLGMSKAAISSKHTLAITNRGGATGEQVAELARFVQLRVENEFAIRLHQEPVLLGLEL